MHDDPIASLNEKLIIAAKDPESRHGHIKALFRKGRILTLLMRMATQA